MTNRNRKRCPTHPGDILREDIIPELGLSKTEVASRLGVSRQTLYDILNKKQPITSDMAVRLGKFLGNGPGIWQRMQSAYDLWQSEQSVDVSAIQPYEAAVAV